MNPLRWLGTLVVCLLALGWNGLGALQYDAVLSSDNIVIYSTRAVNPSLENIASLLDNRIGELQMELGLYPTAKVPVYIVSDKQAYKKLSDGRAGIVEFSDAFYSGYEGRIYIRSGDQINQNYLNVLLHEYIHWFLEQYFVSTPLWFHEGMATYFSGQMGYERYLVFLRESFRGKQGNLYRMSYNYPEQKTDWELFYLSSAMALQYMQKKEPESWKRFWDKVAAAQKAGGKIRFNDAFIMAYNTSLYDFTKAFEAYSRRQGYLYLFVAINGCIFLFLPVVMLFVARKRRRILGQMQDLDLPDEPEDQIQG